MKTFYVRRIKNGQVGQVTALSHLEAMEIFRRCLKLSEMEALEVSLWETYKNSLKN